MNRNAMLLVLLAALSVSPSCWAADGEEGKAVVAKPQEGKAKLTVLDSSYNFGSIKHGMKVEHDFELRNDGDAQLTIRRIQPACGCTVSVAEKSVLQPGEATKIHAAFDSTGFRGLRVIPIRIYTNDPKQPMAQVVVKGEVIHDVVITPGRVFFGIVKKREISGQTLPPKSVSVLADEGSGVKILDVTSRSESLKVESKEITEKGKVGKKLLLSLKGDVPIGSFRSFIIVKTSSSTNSVLNIPVVARVEGDIRLDPEVVSFGLVEGPLKKPLTQSIVLTNDGPPFELQSVKTTDSSITAALEAIEPGKKYRIKVAVQEGFLGTIKSEVIVKTNRPSADGQQIVLRVYGFVAEKGA